MCTGHTLERPFLFYTQPNSTNGLGGVPVADRSSHGGAVVNRIYGTHQTLYIHVFLLTISGPILLWSPVIASA